MEKYFVSGNSKLNNGRRRVPELPICSSNESTINPGSGFEPTWIKYLNVLIIEL
jgi:hypothetical protein